MIERIVTFLYFFSVVIAHADFRDNPKKEVFLRVIHIQGQKSLNSEQAYDIYQEVSRFYTKNTDIELFPAGFITIEDFEPVDDQKSFINNRNGKFWNHILNKRLAHNPRKRELLLIIDRPVLINNILSFGGSSHNCNLYKYGAYTYIFGGDNDQMLTQALHEVGHALGAIHFDSVPSVMNTNPYYLKILSLDFRSKRRIKKCVKKETRKKIRFCRNKKFFPRCFRKWRLR
jgi:hypothetical protein